MLIVNMDMPKNCGECPLLYMEIVKCTVTGMNCTEYGAERPSWCPIKGVLPEEHGDLIDRDALKKEISVSQDTSIIPWVKAREYAEIAKSSTLNIIDDQHAVIEAERKDDAEK